MDTRLALAFVLTTIGLCGCAAESARPTGNLTDGTFYQVIGKPLPNQLMLPDCRVQ